MFSKTKAPAPAQPPRAQQPTIPPLPDLPNPVGQRGSAAPSSASQRGLSTLSSDLAFEGNITGAGDLQIDGQIKGDVRVGRLIVGETGAVEGNVQADYIEVRGRVVGAVVGKQVKLISTAYVDGDVTAEQLAIDIGAFFQGRVLQGARQAPPAAAPQPVAPQPVAKAAPEPAPQVVDMKSTAPA